MSASRDAALVARHYGDDGERFAAECGGVVFLSDGTALVIEDGDRLDLETLGRAPFITTTRHPTDDVVRWAFPDGSAIVCQGCRWELEP